MIINELHESSTAAHVDLTGSHERLYSHHQERNFPIVLGEVCVCNK